MGFFKRAPISSAKINIIKTQLGTEKQPMTKSTDNIQRLKNGAIDTAYYVRRGHVIRSQAAYARSWIAILRVGPSNAPDKSEESGGVD